MKLCLGNYKTSHLEQHKKVVFFMPEAINKEQITRSLLNLATQQFRKTTKWPIPSFTLSRPNQISCCTWWVILKNLIHNLFRSLDFQWRIDGKEKWKTFSFRRWKSCLINQKCFPIIFLYNKADLIGRKRRNFNSFFCCCILIWNSFD